MRLRLNITDGRITGVDITDPDDATDATEDTERSPAFVCESGAEITFRWTGDHKYPVELSIQSSTGRASLTDRDMDSLSGIFRKQGPWFV